MTVIHPGLFYDRVRDRYPKTRSVPPLPPMKERFGAIVRSPPFDLEFRLGDGAELPRAWFISEDGVMVAQLQPDRLHLNWRRRANGEGDATYPHYDEVAAGFVALYTDLLSFASSAELGSVEADQCEMTYINHFAGDADANELPRVSDLFRIWSDDIGADWLAPSSPDVSFTAKWTLPSAEGGLRARLHASLKVVQRPSVAAPALQLDLTARGAPATADLRGVTEFHDYAHEQIVRCFAALTTDAAHSQWERWQ